MLNFNVDFAIECVKTITDNTRCVTCDKLSGPCVRYPCGHSVCEGCAGKAGECLFCVSSPTGSYLVDKPQTIRLNNASVLLNVFQDTFKIDVCKRQRISDHLKLEKLVFPECIQAPQKYCNKRKSLNNSVTNKENLNQTFFPGEEIICHDTAKMKKSFQYVQHWLNQHESVPQKVPRKPFGDININTQSLYNKGKKSTVQLNMSKTQMNAKKHMYVKRSQFKSINNSTSSLNNAVVQKFNSGIDEEIKRNTKVRKKKVREHKKNNVTYKCDKMESGIVLDDELDVVDDTERGIVDKDKLACMAVLEAAERDENQDNSILSESILLHNDIYKGFVNTYKDVFDRLNVKQSDVAMANLNQNVLFYKKSFLSDPCKLCSNCTNNPTNFKAAVENNNDVSIVINNSEFVTTIKLTQSVEYKHDILNKKSVAIQTSLRRCQNNDDNDNNNNNEKNTIPQKRKVLADDDIILPTKIVRPNIAIQSLDIFPTNNTDKCTQLQNNDITQKKSNDSIKQLKSVVIEESDTESNVSHDNMQEVVADVHQTSDSETVGRGILTTLLRTNYQERSNRLLRSHTPNSSDSSDKENVDPNRIKQEKNGKKQKHKINKYYKMNL